MSNSMMRVDKEIIDRIKLLKKIAGSKGSLQSIVDELVCNEIKKTHVETEYGYIGVGAVVADIYNHALVITDITVDKITFRDGSYILNGGKVSRGLKLIAASVDEYDGGVINA